MLAPMLCRQEAAWDLQAQCFGSLSMYLSVCLGTRGPAVKVQACFTSDLV